ncbi:MAG TPA: elongation factor G [Paludibacteraceae bacterium]|jgi:elongation factor G|nr:elongation factor G [Paludibacteraceae bacterium]
MKVYQPNEIKNISLLGSAGSGKTTFVEAILYEAGIIKRKGSIANQNTVSDYYPVEKEYGYSVFPTVIQTEWQHNKLNFIDCPGADDFIGGVVTSLNVTDTTLILVNSQYGVEVGTTNHFSYAEKYNKPVIFVMNHLDHEKVNYELSLESLTENFGNKVIQVQYPFNPGLEFNAIIDLIQMKMLQWKSEGGNLEILEIPAEEMEKAKQLHNQLVEAAAEHDEALMEKFFEEGVLTEEEICDGLRKGVRQRGVFPVFCISALKNIGVSTLMDYLVKIAPSVAESEWPETKDGKKVEPNPNAPTSLYVFKTNVEPHVGEISLFKVMSGTVHEGDDLYNINREVKEKINQLFNICGQIRTKVEEIGAGDIGATVKLKDTRTGNTLNGKGCDYDFKEIKYPDPKYRQAVKAKSEADEEKLNEVLTRMHEEDPTWIVEQSKELKQTILHGQGEFHLRTLKWRVENNDKIEIEFKEPKIPYRETITKQARADYRHKKQSGGAGQFGEVHLIIEPYSEGLPVQDVYRFNGQEYKISVRDVQKIDLEWGGKLIFVNSIVGGAIDARFMPAILKGIMERMEQGPLTGSYARDVRVIVYDGKMHPVDSNEISFRLAGRNAFVRAFKEAGPKLLEPIYDVEVLAPSDRLGDVMSDLQSRRAVIMGMHSEKGFEKLNAKVPLKELGNYSTTLSSLTGGRATFTMKFASYELVPMDIQEKLLKEYEATRKEEE